MKSFNERVWLLLKKIPKGRVTTYKEIACTLHKPKAMRAIGNACRKNPDAPRVPCHRVVLNNGSIGGYAKGMRKKIELLKKEKVLVRNGKVIDFEEKFFRFKTTK